MGETPPLFDSILDVIDGTAFRSARRDSDTLVLRSQRCADLLVVATTADTDPHSPDLLRTGTRRAREHGAARFATANPTDLFVFSPADAEWTAADRRYYDLRRPLDGFAESFLDEMATGDAPDPFDDLVLGRLRSFHAALGTVYEALIADRVASDDRFQESLRAWAADHESLPARPSASESVPAAASAYAYFQVNRLFCYELLRARTAGPLEPLVDGCTADSLDERLADRFAAAVDAYGCEPVFRADTALYRSIPEDERTRHGRYEFVRSLEQEPLDRIDRDVLGALYERVLPETERTERGQFYTPDHVGEILSGWAVQSATDRVLDPCTGSGSLAVRAQQRLAELGGDDAAGGVSAVDVESFPLQLTELNLLAFGGSPRATHHADFFDLEPATDGSAAGPAIGPFDATVANPPYVRQEQLSDDRAHFRAHLSVFGPDGVSLDRRCDLYCYFLTHATRFLVDGARLAWVVPTKWLTADYGPSFQEFLFDHYRVEAVVGFRTRLFEDALVDTVLLLAERTDSESDRLATTTTFLRLDERCSPGEVLEAVERDREIPDDSAMAIERRGAFRAVAVAQSSLLETVGRKLQPYLRAPAVYLALADHEACRPLAEVATISRGIKTGANPIFLLDRATIEAHGIDRRFCRPAIKSVRAVDGFEYTTGDAERWLLDLHEYVAELDDTSPAHVREALRADGYDGLRSYLDWARDQPARSNRSIERYEPWFDLGSLDGATAPILCPQAMDTRRWFVRTDGEVVPSNRFLLVDPAADVDATLLLGLLNATLSQIVTESHGRVTGGGAINLSGSDLETFRLPDPRSLSGRQVAAITDGFERLAAGDASGREQIDRTVVEALDLDTSVAQLRELSRTLKRTRRTDGPAAGPAPDLSFE